MSQKFAAREPYTFSNGATGWRPGGPMDCLGPYAKVTNCPIRGYNARYTCYASGYADTFFSVPANTRIRGKHISGYFIYGSGDGIEFVPYVKHDEFLNTVLEKDR